MINIKNNIYKIILSFSVFIILIGGGYLHSKINNIDRQSSVSLELMQRVDAGITFQTKRQMWVLKVRDIILKYAKKSGVKMNSAKAFKIAESNLYFSEKYEINPNLLLSIQTRESAFNIFALSHCGAQGLNQIMEPTARMLCKMKDWEYFDGMLNDIDISNELACMFIQSLFAYYDNNELVLAAYNGGFRQANYYKRKSKRLATETKNYIPIVMGFFKAYQKTLKQYING